MQESSDVAELCIIKMKRCHFDSKNEGAQITRNQCQQCLRSSTSHLEVDRDEAHTDSLFDDEILSRLVIKSYNLSLSLFTLLACRH